MTSGTAILALIYIFFKNFIIPLLFAIGLMHLIYGSIEYFVAGKTGGDEGRAQNGRLHLLQSLTWFVRGLLVYIVIVTIGWLATWFSGLADDDSENSSIDAGVNINRQENILRAPNVPVYSEIEE